MRAGQVVRLPFARGGGGSSSKVFAIEAFDSERRECPHDIGQQPRPFGGRRGTEQLRRRDDLVRSAVEQGVRRAGAMQQNDRCHDEVESGDRDNDQRRELPADASEIQKTEQLHDRLSAAATATSTVGVNT